VAVVRLEELHLAAVEMYTGGNPNSLRRRRMMSPRYWKWSFLLFLAPFVLSMTLPAAEGQGPAASTPCGKAKVHMGNPVYLTTSLGIVAVELPQGWALDATRKNPFYFLKSGERYESARTLMYINIERLDVPFQRAVETDAHTFSEGCQPSRIEDAAQPDILGQGCEKKTQMFLCERKQGAYADLGTKISVGGLLLNVVLSADNAEEISRYRKDHEFLLKHLALVTP
jgi:hypothetical protein